MTVAPLAQGRSLLLIVAVIVAASVCAAATHTSRHALQGGAREPLLSSSEAVVSTAESDTAPGSGSDPAAAASPASQAQPLPSIDANGDAEGVVQPSSKTAHTAERQLELSWALLPLLRGTDSVVDVASQVPTDASRARPHASAPASSGDWQPPSARRERRGHDTNGTSPASHEDCERPLVLPVVVGVLALSALLASFFLCGRRHVGASLFEQTIRAERYAQVARHEAEVKASFLANMSHEIRTPLHAILSMGRMLMESRQMDPDGDPQDLDDLAQIIRSSETLEALVNDVLFISKMQTSSFTLVNKNFDVCELLEDITQLLALRWEAKRVECIAQLELPEFAFHVTADPLRLRQVLTNLSTNAMKFTDAGHVALCVSLVELHPEDDYASPPGVRVPHLLFRVIDTGAGMEEDTMYNLFQRFFQGTHTITQAVGGAGLGLAIAAELVSIMGGTIGVFSEGDGKGSEFWFTLPIVYQDPALANNKVRQEDDFFDDNTMEMQRHVARVAYERSSDYIQYKEDVSLPDFIAESCATDFQNDIALIVARNGGLRHYLETLLSRWGILFASGSTYAAAVAALADKPKLVPAGTSAESVASIVMVDIEEQELAQDVITRAETRFIFLCTDSHRRHLLRDVTQHWYATCQNYTLLNKPVKREFLWKALHSQGQVEESPSTAAIERIQKEFSFRRNDRPLLKHRPRGGTADPRRAGDAATGDVATANGSEGSRTARGSEHSTRSTDRRRPRSARSARSARLSDRPMSRPTTPQVARARLHDGHLGSSGGGSGGNGGAATQDDARDPSPPPRHAMETDGGLGDVGALLQGQAAPFPEPHVSPSRPAILLAEDNPINVKIALRYLDKAGYRSVVANDGREVIDIFQTQGPFDLILMDCQMPNVDGFEATRAIRAMERDTSLGGRETPIVAMTAFSMPEDQEHCLEQGMNDYISKPFTREMLLNVVAKWLAAAMQTPISSAAESLVGADRGQAERQRLARSASQTEAHNSSRLSTQNNRAGRTPDITIQRDPSHASSEGKRTADSRTASATAAGASLDAAMTPTGNTTAAGNSKPTSTPAPTSTAGQTASTAMPAVSAGQPSALDALASAGVALPAVNAARPSALDAFASAGVTLPAVNTAQPSALDAFASAAAGLPSSRAAQGAGAVGVAGVDDTSVALPSVSATQRTALAAFAVSGVDLPTPSRGQSGPSASRGTPSAVTKGTPLPGVSQTHSTDRERRATDSETAAGGVVPSRAQRRVSVPTTAAQRAASSPAAAAVLARLCEAATLMPTTATAIAGTSEAGTGGATAAAGKSGAGTAAVTAAGSPLAPSIGPARLRRAALGQAGADSDAAAAEGEAAAALETDELFV